MADALRVRSAHDRAILRLAVPALGALAADPLVSLVDTAFVGRLGADPLAALGVAVAVFSVAFVLFNFLAYGTTPLVANEIGRGDRAAANRIVASALAVAVVTGVAAAVVLVVAAGPIVSLMGAGPATAAPAAGYLRIRALAAPALLIVTLGHGAFRGHQDTRTPLVVTLALNAVNLVLDPLLIFAADLGLTGAAYATLIAQWVGAVWFLILLRRRDLVPPFRSARPRVEEIGGFLRVGRDVAIRTLALLAVFTLATAVAARVGTVAVAAHQIVAQLFLFLALSVDALAIAGQALVGKLLGEAEPAGARAVSDRLLVLGLVAGVLAGLAVWLLATPLAGLFTDDPGVVAEARKVLPILAALQPLGAAVFVWDGILFGAGAFRFVALAMVGAAAVAIALMLAVLPLGWGLPGVWWAVGGLMAARAVAMGGWYVWPANPLRKGPVRWG